MLLKQPLFPGTEVTCHNELRGGWVPRSLQLLGGWLSKLRCSLGHMPSRAFGRTESPNGAFLPGANRRESVLAL